MKTTPVKAKRRRRKFKEYRTHSSQWSLVSPTELPDWADRTEQGDSEMLAWLNFVLDKELEAAAADTRSPADLVRAYAERRRRERDERQRREVDRRAATFGPLVEELRSYGAPRQVVDWLHRYAEGRSSETTSGKRGMPRAPKAQQQKGSSSVWFAAQDVERIQALWAKHFGRLRRRKGQMTALDFAARRWGPDDPEAQEEFRDRVKNLRSS